MLSLLHYNLLEVMVLRNKNPPVYAAVTFIFILQGTFHYNFTVFFVKCNNIYIYVEFNPVAIFFLTSALKWVLQRNGSQALLSIENKNRQTEMTISMNTKKNTRRIYFNQSVYNFDRLYSSSPEFFVQTTIKEVFHKSIGRK